MNSLKIGSLTGWFLAGLVLASLLAVDPWGWDRVGPLRWMLVSTFALVAIVGALAEKGLPVRFWRECDPMVRFGWIGLLGGLVVATAVSMLGGAADDPFMAIFGTPDRNLGLLTWLLFALLFSIPARQHLRPIAWAGAIGAGVNGVWSLIEALTDASLANGFGGRAGGAFGQPAYLGAAMLLCLPLAAWLALSAEEPPWARGLAFVATLSGLFALLASGTRASWVGAGVAGLVVLSANGKAGAQRFGQRFGNQGWGAAAGVVLVGVIVIAITPVGPRLADLADLSDGVIAGRFDEWQVGGRALVGADLGGLVGYGPEGYRTVFGAFVDEHYVIDHGRKAITDRAHNTYLDTALAGGWIAGIGLLVVHLGLGLAAFRRLRGPQALSDVALAAAVIAYIVQQWFLFPLAELDPFFWVVAGLLVARPSVGVRNNPVGSPVSGMKRFFGFFAAALAGTGLLAGLFNVVADHRVADAVAATDADRAVDRADAAVGLRPASIRYRFIASRLWSRHPDPEGVDRALDHLASGLDRSPRDPALLTEQASLLLDKARSTGATTDLDVALTALSHLDEVDPNNPLPQQQYGVALALAGRADEATAKLQHASRLAPDAIEPLLNLAVVHLENMRWQQLQATLDEAEDRFPGDARIDTLRADAFEAQQNESATGG